MQVELELRRHSSWGCSAFKSVMDRASSSFDAFVTENGASLLRTAHLITLDHSEAEDLVQECLFELSRRWAHVSGVEHPLAYARRALAHRAYRRSKRRHRQWEELGAASGELAAQADATELVGIRLEVLDALRTLTVRQRTVLALRYFHDLSESQVADALGCSIGTVRSTTFRGLARLRAVIDHEPSQFGSGK